MKTYMNYKLKLRISTECSGEKGFISTNNLANLKPGLFEFRGKCKSTLEWNLHCKPGPRFSVAQSRKHLFPDMVGLF